MNSIKNLIEINAIKKVRYHKQQFLSSYFLIKKPNGKIRFILNLKKLNHYITAPHFKLEDYRTVLKLTTKTCFYTSIDLKDAYFLLPIHHEYRKYLRFQFETTIYEFNCLPFGLNIGPYIFTKIMKPVVKQLRIENIMCIIYLNDLLIIANNEHECKLHYLKCRRLLETLGFLINDEKSISKPTQCIKFLGFQFDSVEMTNSLPWDKQQKVLKNISKWKNKKYCTIRKFSKLIGTLISSCPAVQYGYLHAKEMKHEKFVALKQSHNNYDAVMKLPEKLLPEFNWWEKNILSSKKDIKDKPYAFEIFSDASLTGWGAICEGTKTNGFWNEEERSFHINYLEILAAYNALRSLAKTRNNIRILLRIDNVTAISCINKMGSIKYRKLNNITRKIWNWCEEKEIIIFASYIPSTHNKDADLQSRSIPNSSEYELSDSAFKKIVSRFGTPEIDLFASKSNKKCNQFISWKPDPESA